MKNTCATCTIKADIVKCQGCQLLFCMNDFGAHRNGLDEQLDELADELNNFQQMSNEARVNLRNHLICRIDTWETESLRKIKEKAKEARRQVEDLIVSNNEESAASIRSIAQQLQHTRQHNDFDERDLAKWNNELDELKQIVLKPYISVDKQESQNSFIMNIRINERDLFNQTYGNVSIQEDGTFACHTFNLFGSCGEVRGKRKYNFGIHRIRFKIETLDMHPWWFFGITSESTAMQSESHKSSSTYGWAGHSEVYMNGQCLKHANGYISDFSQGDLFELILDCDHRVIRMINLRSTMSYEINVDLNHCPFPWMLHLNLFHIQTRIRINP